MPVFFRSTTVTRTGSLDHLGTGGKALLQRTKVSTIAMTLLSNRTERSYLIPRSGSAQDANTEPDGILDQSLGAAAFKLSGCNCGGTNYNGSVYGLPFKTGDGQERMIAAAQDISFRSKSDRALRVGALADGPSYDIRTNGSATVNTATPDGRISQRSKDSDSRATSERSG